MSVWLRAWSKFQLARLPQEWYNQIHPSLTGGLPTRTPNSGLLAYLIALEDTMNHYQETGQHWHTISVEAAKCLTRCTSPLPSLKRSKWEFRFALSLPMLLFCQESSADSHALDTFTIGILSQPMASHRETPLVSYLRMLLFTRGLLRFSTHPSLCSALLMIGLFLAPDRELLLQAWQRSVRCDQDNRWIINDKKTLCVSYPPEQLEVLGREHVLPSASRFVLLGHHDVLARPEEVTVRQKERVDAFLVCTNRLARIQLNPVVAQEVLCTAAIPKLCYGIQVHPIPLRTFQTLRGTVKKTMHIQRRAHCLDMLCIVGNPGHHLDPEAACMYTRLLAILKGLKEQPGLLTKWDALWDAPRPVKCGPVYTTRIYLKRPGLNWDPELAGIRGPSSQVRLRDELPKIAHDLRDIIREWYVQGVAATRPHLHGIRDSDLMLTRKLSIKPGFSLRSELLAILAAGVWTGRKRHLCGFQDTPNCAACPGTQDTLEHIWYDCPIWEQYRTAFPLALCQFRSLPPQCCLFVWCCPP